MAVYNLADPAVRAKAIESGLVWSGPAGAQEAAIKDIVTGRVPMPDYLPPRIKARVDAAMVAGK